ncbi:dihydrolipoamide acetyltransferase family protein [Sutcliffiella rhizosphaerae]|nr:dihydrolipoamide acetyltransferase family protein [Sutcliffiella rhizosphaerae]
MEVKLHDIGEGMTQADVLSLFVKAGDKVKPDQPLVEVQTDKMTAEIPAPFAGVIKEIKVDVGQTISVGTTIFLLESETKATNISYSENVEKTNFPLLKKGLTNTEQIQKKTAFRIMAAPYTRKIAREAGVNIEEINGTGSGGRITDEDVLRFIKRTDEIVDKQETHHEDYNSKNIRGNPAPIENTIPFKGRRKQIAHKMSQSLLTIPHCTHFEEVDVTEIINMRESWKKNNQSISASAIFVKAISTTLKEFPMFNARLNEKEETIELIEEHHIGIATNTDLGLIVPVIKNVEKKSLKEIHANLKDLTAKAQTNTLSIQEIKGSSFTISNVGPLGGSIGATPIINQPEVALISFHKTKKRPVVNDNDEIVVRSMMNISMSFDHRVVDGATAVSFTNRLTELLEQPNLLMMELV